MSESATHGDHNKLDTVLRSLSGTSSGMTKYVLRAPMYYDSRPTVTII